MAKHKPTALEFPIAAFVRLKGSNARISATISLMLESDIDTWGEWDYEKNDEDKTWEWDKILEDRGQSGGAIECYALYLDDELQGLMSFDLQGHSTSEGHALVVDYLATNPGNRHGTSGIRDVGKIFLGL